MPRLAEQITVEINTANTAFKDDPLELRRVLEKAEHLIVELSQKSALTCRRGHLLDSNGNTVGSVQVAW